MPFEENEISVNSNGGTELIKRALDKRLPKELTSEFQIICSRVRKIEEDKIRVYWLHDLPEDPETNHLKEKSSRDRFHKLVFCGDWQYNRYQNYLGIPYSSNQAVIDNPVTPFPTTVKEKDTIRLIYSSTPQRGLAILIPVFEKLAEKHKNIHLDVFSSFKIYGWPDADKQFEPLYERIRNHPQMTYHGFAPNDVVREHLLKAHIHAYPSIWMECNSGSVIEAMSAGLLCVHPNYGGLSDTTGGMTFSYQGDSDHNIHANIFYHALDHAIGIATKEETQNYLKLVKMYADNRYGWDKITQQWQTVLESLLNQYPTIESRKIPSAKFEYSTL